MKRDEEGPNLLMKLQVNEWTTVQIVLQNFNKDSKSAIKTPKKSFNFENYLLVEQGQRGVQAAPVHELVGEAAGGDGEGAQEDHRRRRRRAGGQRPEQPGAEGLQVGTILE